MNTFDLNVQIHGYYCIDASTKEEAKEHVPNMIDKEAVEKILGVEIRIEPTDVLESEGGSSYAGEDGAEVHPYDAHFIVHAVMKETASTKERAVDTLLVKLKEKAYQLEDAFMIGIGIEVEGQEVV